MHLIEHAFEGGLAIGIVIALAHLLLHIIFPLFVIFGLSGFKFMDKFIHWIAPHHRKHAALTDSQVVVDLPSKIMDRPWSAAEVRQMAVWANDAGSGSTMDLLNAVASGMERKDERS